MHEPIALPEGNYLKNDKLVKLFIPIMNKLTELKIVSSIEPWDFLYGVDEQSVVAYICNQGIKSDEKQIDIIIDEDEIEITLWYDTTIQCIVKLDINLNEQL